MIYVIDEMPGRGKTTAMIHHVVNGDIPRPVIFITPYRTEIERIMSSCSSLGFETPTSDDHKFIEAKQMLMERKNIVSTHALFGMFDLEAERLVQDGRYTLIMDETPEVVSVVDVTKHDARSLFSQHVDYADNGLLVWTTDDYEGRFDPYRKYIETGNTYRYTNTTWLRMTRPNLFEAFRDVYLMTYMFAGSTIKPYFDMHHLGYENRYIGGDSLDTYRICDSPQESPSYDYRNLIQIETRPKMNEIGNDMTALSKHWFQASTDEQLRILHDRTNSFFRSVTKTPAEQNMWTTFKNSGWDEDTASEERWKRLIGEAGYKKGFVSCSIRGTNLYRHKTALAYIVNRYQFVPVRNMFTRNGIEANDDFFGLSEMLQWIWRSAIRDGKPIQVYVPSYRMRRLLQQWIEDTSKGVRY